MKGFVLLLSLMACAHLINPDIARAQNYRHCAWPIELSPEAYGNATLPETLARYFLMPFDQQYETMMVKGPYPNVRYFSYVAYNGKTPHAIAGGRFDAQIAADSGSNPFVTAGSGNGTYTVAFSRHSSSSGNVIGVAPDFVWVLLRMYIPSADASESGHTLTGGVPLPIIILDGQQLQPCSPINKASDVGAVLNALFPPGVDLQGTEGTLSSDRLWFAAPNNPPMSLLPNPDNKYIAMFPGDQYQPGRLIVIHGKAPGFPDTFGGSPISVPAPGFQHVDMRYWSVCHSNFALPMTTVDCAADLTIARQGSYYTIVISDDLLRPSWLRPDINWLPWGDEGYPKLVFFRTMLPEPNFPFAIQNVITTPMCTFEFKFPNIPPRDKVDTAGQCAQSVMQDYYPVALWCDKSTFQSGGWEACIKGR